MAKISAEMKEMLEREQPFVATADLNGIPNVGPKGSIAVLDDNTIAFAEIVGKKTYANIKVNPRVAVVVTDRKALAGYRFLGAATLDTAGPVYDAFSDKLKAMGLPQPLAVVKIKVEEIYDLSVKNPGEKIG